LTFAACSSAGPSGPIAMKDLPDIDQKAVLADITKLASNEFEGRAPGSKGEQTTVQFLIDQFKAAGLQPGNSDGTWVQKVPLVSLTADQQSPLVVTKGGQSKSFKPNDDVVAFSTHVATDVALDKSEIVFAGYGVQAPELNWDDFRGIDVKGKTIVVLVNDPPVV